MTCPNGHRSAATDYCDTCGEAMPAIDPAGPSSLDLDAGGEAAGTSAGEPAGGGDTGPGAGTGTGSVPCPNCGVPNQREALFCENCGYDHTTGTMPRLQEPIGSAPAEAAISPPAEAVIATPAAAVGSIPARAPDHAPGPGADPSSAPALDPPWVAEVWIDPQWYAVQDSPDRLPSPGLPVVAGLRHTSLLVGRVSASRGIRPDVDCGTDNGVSRRHAQLTWDGQRWWIEDLASSNGTFVGPSAAPLPEAPIAVGVKHEVGPDDRIYLGSWTRIVLRLAGDGEA